MQQLQPFNFDSQQVNTPNKGRDADLNATGHVYAAAYDNGLVKVGYSRRDPEGRIKSHDCMMSVTGASRVDTLISRKVAAPMWLETLLVHELTSRFRQSAREWFYKGDMSLIRRLVAENGIDPECLAAKSARASAERKSEELSKTFSELLSQEAPEYAKDMQAIKRVGSLMQWDDQQNIVALIQVAEKHGISSGWLFDLLENPDLIDQPGWFRDNLIELLAKKGVSKPHLKLALAGLEAA